MKSGVDVFEWSSADSRVKEALEGFSSDFKNDLDRQYANKVEKWVLQYEEPAVAEQNTTRQLHKYRVGYPVNLYS